MSDLYDTDFYAWTEEQAALLRGGKTANADLANIAEEIESMGRGERNALTDHLATLLAHLLKWQFQPNLQGNSWRLTIREQRRRAARLLAQNPSLKAKLPEILADAYGDAVLAAERETDLPDENFPPTVIWTAEQVLDQTFWPDDSNVDRIGTLNQAAVD